MVLKVLASVITLLLLVVPAILLGQNIHNSGGAKELLSPSTGLSPSRDNYYGTPAEISPPDKGGPLSDFCVTFEFLGLDPTTSYANFGILIGVTEQARHELKHLAKLHYKTVSLWVTSFSG